MYACMYTVCMHAKTEEASSRLIVDAFPHLLRFVPKTDALVQNITDLIGTKLTAGNVNSADGGFRQSDMVMRFCRLSIYTMCISTVICHRHETPVIVCVCVSSQKSKTTGQKFTSYCER